MTSSSCKICKWCPCPNSSHLITTSLGIVQKAVLAFCTTLVRPGQGWVTNSGFLVFPAFQLLIWDDLGLHTGALPNCITSVIVFGTWLWAWADICRAILVQESYGSQVSFLEKHTVVLSRNLQDDSIAIFAGVSRASFRSGEVAAVEGSLPCGNQAAMSDARLLWLISGTPFTPALPLSFDPSRSIRSVGPQEILFNPKLPEGKNESCRSFLFKTSPAFSLCRCSLTYSEFSPWDQKKRAEKTRVFQVKSQKCCLKNGYQYTNRQNLSHSGYWTVWAINWAKLLNLLSFFYWANPKWLQKSSNFSDRYILPWLLVVLPPGYAVGDCHISELRSMRMRDSWEFRRRSSQATRWSPGNMATQDFFLESPSVVMPYATA